MPSRVPGGRTLEQSPCSRKFDHKVEEINEVILGKEEMLLLECLILRNLKTKERQVFDKGL